MTPKRIVLAVALVVIPSAIIGSLFDHAPAPAPAPVKRAPAAVPVATAKPAPKPPLDWECRQMPNLNGVCVNLAKMKTDKATGNVTAPLQMIAPNGRSIVEGHTMEVACRKGGAQMVALQDRNGTRYGAAYAWESPDHTRQLAEEICKAAA